MLAVSQQDVWSHVVPNGEKSMEYFVGLVVGGFAAVSGFARDRSFYPTVLIVIASYYSLFAVMAAPPYTALMVEIAAGLVFAAAALISFRTSMWIAAGGIAGHGIFDFVLHPVLATNPGMPVWWPGFCGTIDVVIGGWLALCLWRAQQHERGRKTSL